MMKISKKIKNKSKILKSEFLLKNYLAVIAVAFLISIVFFVIVVGWGIYNLGWRNRFIVVVSGIIPYPAARVDGEFILYRDFFKTFSAAEKFYNQAANSQPLTYEELKKIVINDRLIRDVLIRNIAKKYQISVMSKEIEARLGELSANLGSDKELKVFLQKNYSLSLKEYEKYFIKPTLYFTKVSQAIEDDTALNGQAKQKIQAAYNDLQNSVDFTVTQQKYNEVQITDEQKQNIYHGLLPADIEDQLYSLDEGAYSDVLSLDDSLQIIKIISRDDELGVLKVERIIVPITTLNSLLAIAAKDVKIEVYAY